MSIQDDIFDVLDALKGKPEDKAFQRILARFQTAETNELNYEKVINAIAEGRKALAWIDEEFGK